MTTPLFDPPPVYALPVSWHGDLVVDFQQKDPDNPTEYLDYAAGVQGFLDVMTDPPQRFTAAISTYHAIIRVESDIADDLKKGRAWAFILSYPGSPSTEVVAVNGVIDRYDGLPA